MNCKHAWICDDSQGGEVPAKCRECGVERVFKPGFVDTNWNHPVSPVYVRRKPETVMLGDEAMR